VTLDGEELVVAPLKDGTVMELAGKTVRFHEALLKPTGKHTTLLDDSSTA